MSVSGRIYTTKHPLGLTRDPVIGTRTYGGGIYLNPEEARWITELLGRVEVVEGSCRISRYAEMTVRDQAGFAEYTQGAAKHDVSRKIADELNATSTRNEAGETVHVVKAYIVRGGLPPAISVRRNEYVPKTIDLDTGPSLTAAISMGIPEIRG